jgi:hypothetical protein
LSDFFCHFCLGSLWQPAKKLFLAIDFGWRSDLSLRSVSLFSVSASAAEVTFDHTNEFFRRLPGAQALIFWSAAARLKPRPSKSVDAFKS